MEYLVPSIAFVRDLRSQMERGQSVRSSIYEVCRQNNNSFTQKMSLWLIVHENQLRTPVKFKTHLQKSLIEVLTHGLSGAPIYEHLTQLENEMNQEFERQWKAYLEALPMKLSLPLMFCFFPSYLILLFGPLIIQFLSEVNI